MRHVSAPRLIDGWFPIAVAGVGVALCAAGAWGQPLGLEGLAKLTPGRTKAENALWIETPLTAQFKTSKRVVVAVLKGPAEITMVHFAYGQSQVFTPSKRLNRDLLLRIYWDGEASPSVECPLVDFFCDPAGTRDEVNTALVNVRRGFNAYFPMPFRKSAVATVTNEGRKPVGAFYSNIDYQLLPAWPEDALYFHAQYRQASPCVPSQRGIHNLDGKDNYVFCETRGRGHLMGVTLGVIQNADGWFGEGDDMIFVDDETTPVINGTGTEDYFLGSWDFGGRDGAQAFAHRFYGAPLIALPERTGGRYCCYRWHGDNPVTFTKYLKHTIEHGHANDRGDNYFSVGYWYQSAPATDLVPLPPVEERNPRIKL